MKDLSTGQVINLALASFLLLGIATSVYAVTQIRLIRPEAGVRNASTQTIGGCDISKQASGYLEPGQKDTFTMNYCVNSSFINAVANVGPSNNKYSSEVRFRVVVTQPNGLVLSFDNPNGSSVYGAYATQIGSTRIEVENIGTKKVSYSFGAGCFKCLPGEQ